MVRPAEYYFPPKQRHVQGEIAPHGTNTRYVQHKCRCDECEAANRRAARACNLRKGYFPGRSDWEDCLVDAGQARAHLIRLVEWIPLVQIERITGTGHTALWELKSGARSRIFPGTRDAIFAVSWKGLFEKGSPGCRVPAGPTWRLIEELLAAGFPKVFIAGELGQHTPGLQLKKTSVLLRHARAVQAFHDRLWAEDAVGSKASRYGGRIVGKRLRECCHCSWSDEPQGYPALGEQPAPLQLVKTKPCPDCLPNRLCFKCTRDLAAAERAELERLKSRLGSSNG